MAVNEYGTKTVLSRRTFVGGAMLAGTAIALFGLGGCAPRDTASTGSGASFTPGTYTGEADGKFDTIVVETEFSENAIESVKVVQHRDTTRIAEPAVQMMPERIVARPGSRR